MTNCRLCFDLPHGSKKVWNVPLLESPNFVALPSLGALVEGWLLLMPKRHFICMGALPPSFAAELMEMKYILCSILQEYYGQISVFEHGPSRSNLGIGCGVDHAHLHIVPLAFDLLAAATSFLPEDVLWSKAGLEQCQAAFHRGEDYLYLEQPIGIGRIATHNGFGSQLLRRAIATRVGAPNEFNWREDPQLPKVLATIDKFRSWGGGVYACKNRLKVAA